jgi:hypothetical protein
MTADPTGRWGNEAKKEECGQENMNVEGMVGWQNMDEQEVSLKFVQIEGEHQRSPFAFELLED